MSAAMLRIMYTVWTAVVLYAVRTSGDHAGDLYSGVWPIVSVARLERPLVGARAGLMRCSDCGGSGSPKGARNIIWNSKNTVFSYGVLDLVDCILSIEITLYDAIETSTSEGLPLSSDFMSYCN